MIHVATVHWNSDRWIPIQLAYLKRNIPGPYRVYAWLNGIANPPLDAFHYACTEPVQEHPIKLNILADIIYFDSNRDDDIIVFLDGDAFPIADIERYVREKLKSFPLVAVQRRENAGDRQPHPCFCATTVGFWRRIRGDWKAGHQWQNSTGRSVTDVGGNLLKQLTDAIIPWHQMLRTNKKNPHPIFFAIYDNVVYHHATGFRDAWSRSDEKAFKEARLRLDQASLGERILKKYMPFARRRHKESLRVVNRRMSAEVFARIEKDPDFYREFI
jgi:hypothetical protein